MPSPTDSAPTAVAIRRIALAGNPNAGKTTLFNALTGMRQKVGNYPGVTVEKKEGRCHLPGGSEAVILDLPGTYSLSPKSPDEEIARDVLLGLRPDTPVPDAVVVVVDASNLERHLFLATQILELGIPTVIALNMGDVAAAAGKAVDAAALSAAIGAPVVETIAVRGDGLPALRAALETQIPAPTPPPLKLAEAVDAARTRLAQAIEPELASAAAPGPTHGVALRLLSGNVPIEDVRARFGESVAAALTELQASTPKVAFGPQEVQARYAMLGPLVRGVVEHSSRELPPSFTDRADAILTHRVWGLAIFALITLLVFKAIFSWSSIPMDLIDGAKSAFAAFVESRLPEGPVRELVVNGIIEGVGAVVIFLPQILILFFFIGLLEDSGYMARAAFMMDRMMGRVGLHGRAFIPLMSSFACAIPGIMAARTISSRRDRMTTILIAPLMACSARLPVYALMIGTFIPNTKLLSVKIGSWQPGLGLQETVMFSLYVGGVIAAMAVAWLLKKTIFAGPQPALMLELPPYKIPAWRNVFVTMWDRGAQFLQRAGTIIMAITIVLWFMLSYPKIDPNTVKPVAISPMAGVNPGPEGSKPIAEDAEAAHEKLVASEQSRHSYGGRIGHAIEPVIAPLGFNWKIGIGLIGAMAAREVFVATMGTVYSVGSDTDDEKMEPQLVQRMHADKWPDGRPVWTQLTAISVLVYFVLAMQCVSTLAVVKRETNSWKWPIFMLLYLTVLAWGASFIVYQGGKLLGFV